MSTAATSTAGAHGHRAAVVAWPEDPHFGSASAGKIGMWIFLLSDCLSFAGLLLAYGILRGGADTWRHAGEPSLGIGFTAVLTFLLICSSVTMVFAYSAALEGKRRLAVRYLGLTVLGGVLFLCGQMQEYFGLLHVVFGSEGLIAEGLQFGRTHYATTFFCITGFHGMHVFAGVTYLTVILVRTARGRYDAGRVDHIEIAGLFWHFVDLVWILVFTLVYLIPE